MELVENEINFNRFEMESLLQENKEIFYKFFHLIKKYKKNEKYIQLFEGFKREVLFFMECSWITSQKQQKLQSESCFQQNFEWVLTKEGGFENWTEKIFETYYDV